MEHLHVPDIQCEGCAEAIRQALGALPGVVRITVEVATKRVDVEGTAPREQLVAAIRQAGFEPQ